MKTSRTDVERNKQQSICVNSSWQGFSSNKLRCGDLFTYNEKHIGGIHNTRFAKCHGQIKPKIGGTWQILAQVSNDMMTTTFERWVDANDVMAVRPQKEADPNILKYFEAHEAD